MGVRTVMSRFAFGLVSMLLAGTAFAPGTAWADEGQPGEALEAEGNIIVTGQRQAYRGDFTLRETPQAITQIGQEQIDANNLTRLTDALDLSASVARQNNFGGLWDAYAVRGFAGDENLPSG